ncbi:PQQ-binding-like beta-propeller repeat protein [Streptomyces antimycoticus]|uniref:Pyrrolo-quinoline quinone repeat domain-containing protein n=1 Tax=Streptomyces antimycoticus TaxID=68175 RepID=A0A4D4K9W7_9ACTN|nr:hypothetical protein SANT12839_068130 [Streptomyces antimycoticus]
MSGIRVPLPPSIVRAPAGAPLTVVDAGPVGPNGGAAWGPDGGAERGGGSGSTALDSAGGISRAAGALGPGWLPGRLIAALSELSSAVLAAEIEPAEAPSPVTSGVPVAPGAAVRRAETERGAAHSAVSGHGPVHEARTGAEGKADGASSRKTFGPSLSPSRRRLLLGVAGGTAGLAVGGGATWPATAPDSPAPLTPAQRLAAHRPRRRLPGAPPTPLWRYDVKGVASAYAPLVWRDEVAVLTGKRAVVGIDLRTGKRTLAAGGTVLSAGGGGVAGWLLRGDEAEAGGRPWEAEPLAHYNEGTAPSPLWGPVDLGSIGVADARIPAPLPVRDLVVAPAEGGRLRAYDVRTGRTRWTSRTAGLTGRPLAVSDDTVLTVDSKGVLHALNAQNGKERWKAPAAEAATLLAVDGEAVYIATRGGELRAVALTSQTSLWTVPSPVRTSEKNPAADAVADGRLVVCGEDGQVVALDTARGKPLWGPARHVTTALASAVADGTVYLGGRSLTALTLSTGEKKWSRLSGGGHGWGAPVVAKDVVYAVDTTDLSARRTDDGTDAWTLTFASEDSSQDAR